MDTSFVILPNDFVFRSDVSPASKGVAAYMAAKPSDWRFCAYRMAKDLGCGERHVKACLKELISR